MSTMAEVIREQLAKGTYQMSGDHLPYETVAEHVADALTRAGYGELADAFPIIRDLADPDDCWFDHHGGCQAHGYLSLEPGETCPQHDAKEWLKANEGSAS